MKQGVIVGLVLLVFCAVLNADVPRYIHFQGFLTDSGGNPLSGTYTITFRIYDVETGGSHLWEETHNSVTVTNGYYDVILGKFQTLSLPFDTQYYLSINVNSDGEMSPRYPMCAAPYALRSAVSDDAAKLNGQDGAFYRNYNNLTNVPSSFPPSSHTHAGSDITSTVASAVNADTVDGKHASDFAEVSHTHSAAQITSGILDIARIPTGTTGTTCALGNHNHTGVYAPASHTHAGSDITSAVASAVNADTVDGKHAADFADASHTHSHSSLTGLSNDDHTQYLLVNGTRNMTGALNLGNNNLTNANNITSNGNVTAGGNFTYSSAKTYYLSISAAAFNPSASDDTWWNNWAYGYISGGTSPFDMWLHCAPISLPQGAVVTGLDLYYYDNDATYDVTATLYLFCRGNTATSGFTIAQVSITSSGSSTNIQTASTTANTTINNQDNQYTLALHWVVPNVSGNLMFYGCRIKYTITTLAP